MRWKRQRNSWRNRKGHGDEATFLNVFEVFVLKRVIFQKIERFLWYWVPPLIYGAFIFVLSSFSEVPSLVPYFFASDKLIHAIEYGILGFLVCRALFSLKTKPSHGFLVLALILSTLYGISDEIHQIFVLGRTASLGDIAADGVGASIGIFLYTRVTRQNLLKRRIKKGGR